MLQNLFQLPLLPTPLLKLLLLFQTEGLSFSQGVFVKFGKNPVPWLCHSFLGPVCVHTRLHSVGGITGRSLQQAAVGHGQCYGVVISAVAK